MSTQVAVYIEGTGTSNAMTDVCCAALDNRGYDMAYAGCAFNSNEEAVRNLPSVGGATAIAEEIHRVFREHDPEAKCRVVVTYIEQSPFDVFNLNEEES